ncbi:hypothetical protein EA658_16715 [Pseudoxanthomonas winnipegensis]|uniref:Uncharacterized protein n=1 Tax=Pseudoxanthomonas winnipegensis TaxID=2480810 RepID=A0ABY1WCJ9_9GAMM|nr:hypothetical protein [Pseudoxanthomonas winnipegensis]TAA11303.1 hypothetical protein EA659_08130 [Pseudoxanthomonas winnipegensis]TAA18726.1 hypothetical protein EA658_16715 [Pseudoxanthomonas winnipegensis]TAH73897.1 hypothetical protein EA657_00030 [Pseudoxanthomonas winnipegensis]
MRNERFGLSSPTIVVPVEGGHLWRWFWDLSARRRSGPEALSYAEISAWRAFGNKRIEPEEVETLVAMDDAYLRAVREEQAAARERANEKKPGANHEWR